MQDALAENFSDMFNLVTVPMLVKEIAVLDAMRAAGTSNFGAASPTDLIQLLLSQSKTGPLSSSFALKCRCRL